MYLKEKNVKINYTNSLNKDELLNQDKTKLRQIIFNVISNSIKFSKEWWKIDISIEKKNKNIVLEIQDYWIWIKKEDQKKLFKIFSQIKNSFKSNKYSWYWLGLYIIKFLSNNLWIKFKFISDFWKWTKFIFKIPLINKK